VLPDQIDDAPTSIALLNVRESERRHLRPSETAAEKHRQNGAIAKARVVAMSGALSRLCA
jgi:hypothetical protein